MALRTLFNSILFKNFSWTLLGSIIYSLSQWGILIVLAKLGNANMIGLYSLGLSITAPIIIFLNLQLREVQATDSSNEFNFNEYFTIRGITNFLALIVIIIIPLILNYEAFTYWVIVIVGISKILESFSDICYGYFQKHEAMHLVSKSKITRGILSLFTFTIILIAVDNILIATLAQLIVWGIILIFYDIRNLRNMKKALKDNAITNNRNKSLVGILKISLPLGVIGLIDSLNLSIPRIIVEKFSGVEELGYFSSIVYLMMVGGTVIAALGQAFTARLSRYYAQDVSKYKRLLSLFLIFASVIGVVLIILSLLFGDTLLGLIYNDSFKPYQDILTWIMVAATLWYIAHAVWCGIVAARVFAAQTPIFIAVFIVTVVSSLILIPLYSLTGAAIGICLGMLVRLIGSVILYNVKVRKL